MCKSNINKLYICHACHRRLRPNEDYIKYKFTTIICNSCFVENIDKIDISAFMTTDILIQNEDSIEEDFNEQAFPI